MFYPDFTFCVSCYRFTLKVIRVKRALCSGRKGQLPQAIYIGIILIVHTMSKGGPVGEDEERAILEALESGKTTRQVAEDFDRAPSTISDVAKRNGLDLAERSETKKAAIAKSCYASEARIELVGELLNKAKQLMKSCDSSRDLQYLATAIAIGIDKRRLEEGPGHGEKAGEIKQLFDRMEDGEAADNKAAGDIGNEPS